jgi:transcription antitermination factor NusG
MSDEFYSYELDSDNDCRLRVVGVATRQRQWFAAYVRSRHESRVMEHMAARQVEAFLPQYKDTRQWSDRKTELLLPLFPGYVFVRIPRTLENLLNVVAAPGVVYLVGANGTPEALEDAEIEQLKSATHNGNDPRPHQLIHVGDRVKVTRGPLQGREGFLVREKNKCRVVVEVRTIGRAMSVEVDADAVTAI